MMSGPVGWWVAGEGSSECPDGDGAGGAGAEQCAGWGRGAGGVPQWADGVALPVQGADEACGGLPVGEGCPGEDCVDLVGGQAGLGLQDVDAGVGSGEAETAQGRVEGRGVGCVVPAGGVPQRAEFFGVRIKGVGEFAGDFP